MTKRSLLVVAALAAAVAALSAEGAETCIHKSDKTEGQNKICFYSCPSGDAAITLKSYQVCPVTIKR